jgi:predicted membrane-bound mannosyltransferase
MDSKQNWLEQPIHPVLPKLTNEVMIFAAIILLAIVTRFYDLGSRVMSHDESLHTYFSWLLYRGQGYEHSPMMHGPLQFHMLALTYFLFGVSDFTSRIPAALFSIAIVWMVWYWRIPWQVGRRNRGFPDGHFAVYALLRTLRPQ